MYAVVGFLVLFLWIPHPLKFFPQLYLGFSPLVVSIDGLLLSPREARALVSSLRGAPSESWTRVLRFLGIWLSSPPLIGLPLLSIAHLASACALALPQQCGLCPVWVSSLQISACVESTRPRRNLRRRKVFSLPSASHGVLVVSLF